MTRSEACGYRVSFEDGRTCAVCTDLGHVTKTVDENILGCDLVLLESNYDENMLKNGPYPYYLKERILSASGHLSNKCCAGQARRLISRGTTRIVLGHLSQENNTPQTAEKTVLSGLSEFKRDMDYILKVAPVETDGASRGVLMINVKIVAVGNLKEQYLKDACRRIHKKT